MKRFEMYLGWKCNHACLFCNESINIEKFWDKEFSEKEILEKLVRYKKRGYNHVTYLGGEPFIQKNFKYAIRAAKALDYTLLVTTNAVTLQQERIAKTTVPFIDELIISFPSLDPEMQKEVNQTDAAIDYDKVFSNINKYFRGNFIKVNTLIGKYNYKELNEMVELLHKHNIKEFALTYPDLGREVHRNADKILMRYSEFFPYLIDAYNLCKSYDINLKICDIPLCCLHDIVDASEDFVYDNRLKIAMQGEEEATEEREIDRKNESPRQRKHVDKCKLCAMKHVCWGPAENYVKVFFDDSEIIPLKEVIDYDYKGTQPQSCVN